MSHTPGPYAIHDWFALGGIGYEIEARDQMIGGTYYTGDRGESLANARLFAASAEMLDALEAGIAMREAQVRYFRNRTQANLQASLALESAFDKAARAAVGKARGVAPPPAQRGLL